MVEGRLISSAEGNPLAFDRRDGSLGTSFEMNALLVSFLQSKAEGETNGGKMKNPVGEQQGMLDDDIPF